MSYFVTSDTHFGHKNIFEPGYCESRKAWFDGGLKEHDDALARMWNSTIGNDDTVIHCGDFAFGGAAVVKAYRERLNGRIIIAVGNHDRTITSMRSCFRPSDVVGNRISLRLHEADGKSTSALVKHIPLEFTAHEESLFDALWHGHIHDRPFVPPSDKYIAFGIDTRPLEPFVHLTALHVTIEEVTP